MEVVMLTQDINSLFSSLGCPLGEDYIIGDDCLETLQEILRRLHKEDKFVRGFRRLIANSQVLKKDLLPLFYNVKNDNKILDLIIRILENMTIPVECLLPINIMIKEDAGRSTICQLNWLLTACKEAFLNPSSTKSVVEYIKLILKKDQQVTAEGVHSLSLCLLLLRNLLHIPEVRGGAPGGGASHQNQIIWNLFTQHFDKVLIQLMTDNSQTLWCVTVVQLISLLFKDQHSNTIYKLLNTWCDTALSESSEDDESNTSPQDRGSGDSSSSMVTSDRTSDSSDSDHQKHKMEGESKHQIHQSTKHGAQSRMTELLANGVGRKAQVAMRNKHNLSKISHHTVMKHRHSDSYGPDNKIGKMSRGSESGLGSSETSCCSSTIKMECDSAEVTECGYVSQHQGTNSTSSNEDKEPARFGKKKPIHPKTLHLIQKSCYNGKIHLTSQARKDLCRKKLMKRSKTTTMSIKTFLNHTPSEEDISQLLKEFTVDFLLKGYCHLVAQVKAAIISTVDTHLDTSHFTWLIMYFLRFAAQLELDLELIQPVLSYDLISYLTYEGVNLSEKLEVNKLQGGEDLAMVLRKQYLVVASLKEILFTLDCYKKVSHLSHSDCKYLRQLREKISCLKDLKYLFVLLLCHFDPQVQSHQFLQDLVVANHYLLVLIENCPQTTKTVMTEHIKQFASEDVMAQYGVLLACFAENGEIVNDCIFTMMHHVAGDLERVSVLFQPAILRSFTRILDTEFEIRDEWLDLVEYVLQRCLKTKQVNSKSLPKVNNLLENKTMQDHPPAMPETQITPEWSDEDKDSLCWYYTLSFESADPIGKIAKLYTERSGQMKNRFEIIEHLRSEGMICENQHKEFLAKEPTSNVAEPKNTSSSEMDILEGIKIITEYLNAKKYGFFIKWLQGSLLEACYARLVCNTSSCLDTVEPVTYFNTMFGQPVPLVTWTQELWRVMQLDPSVWLLTALNFHLPTRVGKAKIFARIPSEWTADHLYVAALILGPLDSSCMKFDPSTLQVIQHSGQLPSATDPPSTSNTNLKVNNNSNLFGFFLGSSSAADWIQKVKQLSSSSKVHQTEDKHEWMSTISGDERDWDLTSMCVSDEGARHEDITTI